MSLSLGSTTIGSLYLGSTRIGAAYLGSTKVYESLSLPAPGFVRMTFPASYDPTQSVSWVQWTQVSSSPNVWDMDGSSASVPIFYDTTVYNTVCNCSSWPTDHISGLNYSSGIRDVTLYLTGGPVTDLGYTFMYNTGLTNLTILGSSSVTSIASMCSGCSSLQRVPLFETDSITSCMSAFSGCSAVESGALALYQQMSSQANPPTSYDNCFTNCGSDTISGAAELALIPNDWK